MRRANRRMAIVITILAASAIGSVLAGFLVSSSGAASAALVAGVTVAVAAGVAIPALLAFWLVKRRTGTAVSPLWGASRQVRARVARAIRTGADLPPGEQPLAVAEATRVWRLGWAPVVGSGIAGLLFAAQAVLRVVARDPAWQIAGAALPAVCFVFLAVQQFLAHRRSGAYLKRLGVTDPA